MNDTPHHGLFSYTIGETKTKNITPYVSSFQLENILRRYRQFFGAEKNNLASVLLITEKRKKQLLQCNTGCYRGRRERVFQTNPSPAPVYTPQTTYLSQSLLCPANINLLNSFPSPTTVKFHLSELLHLPLPEHFIPRRNFRSFKLSFLF